MKRYTDLNEKSLPGLRPWVEKNLGIDINYKTPSISIQSLKLPTPLLNQNLLEFLQLEDIYYSYSQLNRLTRSHGQTLEEIINIRIGKIKRIPDLVVWPRTEKQILKIIEGAKKFKTLLIPIGGGTCVSQALKCPNNVQKLICSVDMEMMNSIINLDVKNMTATVQAGILGQDLEKQLNEKGFTCGHEPDSLEFSTLGGWISTRASGMKKNKYGNIEDLLLSVRICTSKGILQPRRLGQVPRLSSGPDLLQLILGSEGQMGIISEATIKAYSLVFLLKIKNKSFIDFESGVNFFRNVALKRCQPASLRLVDNAQFQMGQAMRIKEGSYITSDIWQTFARIYLTRWKGFKPDQMVATTCVFEGSKEEVEIERQRLFTLASNFGGIRAPDENGQFGYRLTFAIAYLRDLALDFGVIGESFETSVPWSKVINLCKNVKTLIIHEASKYGIKQHILATCRVTQVYDSGACVYFYFAFNYRGMDIEKALEIYENIEASARNEILACGGSISHHHGIGKIRKRWLPTTIGNLEISLIKSLFEKIDPEELFKNENLFDESIQQNKEKKKSKL
ncbi:Alkylglycerone-phosphate synthase [Meloidogyne graminicola]|uniref:Alkylglycerone-phosphate synthase n=1 Tax=Meloidogyne graminicola TaxID=189291 RepID=A0A8T0A0Z3_9BILA|nr:Alkylglycerone-phosphate synthase [Meloidogyne graminicola]